MVPDHVQGLSRVPPEQPEGGAGVELDSRGLCGKPEVQSLKSKTWSLRAETWFGAREGDSTESHLNATYMRP